MLFQDCFIPHALELKSNYINENKNLSSENTDFQNIKFFVETWYFNWKLGFFDLIFEKLDFFKLSFLIEKIIFKTKY